MVVSGHPSGLGEDYLLGVQGSVESPTDVDRVCSNIAGDGWLSPKREGAAGDIPVDVALDRNVSNAFQVTHHLGVRVDEGMLDFSRWGAALRCRSGAGSGAALADSLGG